MSVAILTLATHFNEFKNEADTNSDIMKDDTADVTGSVRETNATEISNMSDSRDGDKTAEDCYKSVDDMCPVGVPCRDLDADCLQCDFNVSCNYGSKEFLDVLCTPKAHVNCTGDMTVSRKYQCRYCYQLELWQYECNSSTSCSLLKPRTYFPARPSYTSVCKTRASEFCLGRRCFYKQQPCNWSNGYKWSTALMLSITLGGFGVDRFYLGLWREGIGKLFSFGGLGVWTLVDVILIAVGYVGPQDGSLYI